MMSKMLLDNAQPQLPKAEERALLERHHDPDCPDEERLEIEARLLATLYPFIVNAARKTCGMVSSDDLAQVGCMGALHAIRRFGLEHDVRLSTFACTAALRRMWRERDEQWSLIRSRYKDRRLVYRIAQREMELASELGRGPTNQELSDAIGVSMGEIEALRQISGGFRIDWCRGNENTQYQIPARHEQRDEQWCGPLVEKLSKLTSQRNADMVADRLGLDGVERTLAEVAEKYGVTRERVRQIEEQFFETVKSFLRKHGFFPKDLAPSRIQQAWKAKTSRQEREIGRFVCRMIGGEYKG